MRYEDIPHVYFKKVKISNICYRNVLATVEKAIKAKERGYICLTEVSNLMAAARDEQLKAAINGSLLSLADGTPLAWYAWMVGCREIERISGASLMQRFFTDMDGCRHYLLGDTEQTIDRVISEARKMNNRIEISGHSPPFKVFDDVDDREMMKKIREADPDIIWVSFGGGKQEKWMQQNLSRLDKGVMIGVGAAFRFLIGDIFTPPLIFQRMGLQGIFRMIQYLGKYPLKDWLLKVKERDLLKSKVKFITSLPHEVSKERRQLELWKRVNGIKV